jgi:hypothetical protein
MERCEQHLRIKSYDGNCPDCVIDREVGKVGEAAGERIAELESKLDAAEDRCHFYDPSGTDDDGQCCKTCGTGALAHDPKVLEVSARILGRIAHLESERDPYRNLLDIETRDARIKDLESRLDSELAKLRTLAIGMVGARMAHVDEDYAEAYHLLYIAARQLSDDPYEPWKALDALAAGAIERRDGQTFVNIPVVEKQKCLSCGGPTPCYHDNDADDHKRACE